MTRTPPGHPSSPLFTRPAALARCPRALRLVLKALHQLLTLAWLTLFSLPRPDVILLQLPPAIPTMAVLRAAALRHGARLVFDWHNYAYTLMGLSMGPRHPLASCCLFWGW